MIKIVNLTPHPVTIIREGREHVTYPACAPTDLPRAVESEEFRGERIGSGIMEISVSGDTQDAYANACTFDALGIIDRVGYVGTEALPPLPEGEVAFGVETFRIVSIVTALAALAEGRPIVDLLIPRGQVRDAAGRIIGASGLAPASSLLSPVAQRLIEIGREQVRGSLLAARVKAAAAAGLVWDPQPMRRDEVAAADVPARDGWVSRMTFAKIDQDALRAIGLRATERLGRTILTLV